MSVPTEAEARLRIRKSSSRIALASRRYLQGDLKAAEIQAGRHDHAEARVELAIIQSLAEAPELSPERRARLAEMLTAGDSK